MREPNLLVISNKLKSKDLQENLKGIMFVRWDEERLRSFSDRHGIIIDFSFDNNDELEKINPVIYQSLGGRLTKPIIEKGLIVILICGYEDRQFNMLDMKDREEYSYDSYNSYDFLRNLDEILKPKLEFNECEVQEKEVNSPFRGYFKLIDGTSSFTFQYDPPEHDPNIMIEPISKTQGFGKDTCVAVRIQIGKGFLIILPRYNKTKKKEVFSSCINIGRDSYIKQQYGGVEVDPAISPHVASDYLEALLCRRIGAYKATVTMCRRALQASLLEMGASKKLRLEKQIDELFGGGKITQAIRDEAHRIRLLGNVGAHPDKDGLKDASEQEVEQMLKFMDAYFQCVYITPKTTM